MKTDLVIGSSGQDGSLLLQFLRGNDLHIYGLSRTPGKDEPGVLTVDVSIPDDLIDALNIVKPTTVYFFAGISVNDDSIPLESHRANYLKPLQVCANWIGMQNYEVNLVVASSILIYGDQTGKIYETNRLAPVGNYATCRAEAIDYFDVYSPDNVNTVFCVFGGHESVARSKRFLFGKILRSFSGNPIDIPPQCLNDYRDWGYAPEYMNIVTLLRGRRGCYNLVTGQNCAVGDILQWFWEEGPNCGLDVSQLKRILYLRPTITDENNEYVTLYSNDKLQQDVGCRPTVAKKALVSKILHDFKLLGELS